MHFEPKGQNETILLYVAGMVMLLLGCSPRISNVALPIEDVKEFSTSGESVLQDKWWTAFEDEQLNTLIDSAMQRNFDLAATWQQLIVRIF